MSEGEICARHYATGRPLSLHWQNGIFTRLAPASPNAAVKGWVAPPLFDLQINGYAGIDFQADGLTLDDLLKASRGLARDGSPRYLLTLITDEWSALTARLKHLKALRDASPELCEFIAGWHIEGPFLSAEPGFRGAHNPALMQDPALPRLQELRAIIGNDPLLLTVSPERNGSLEFIAAAKQLGITISLGHTNASAGTIREAVAKGARGFTHLGNGCPQQLDRHDNIVWRVLDCPDIIPSLIPDCIHVSPLLFRLVHRTVPPERIYYTTDAMAAAGAPPGRYRIGRVEVEVGADQVVRQPGQTNFAGSALRPSQGIFRAAEMLGRPWQSVWNHFSAVPARLMNLPWTDFSPENFPADGVPMPASFCLIDEDTRSPEPAISVFVRGRALTE